MSEYYHTKYTNLLRWPSELECNRITTYTLANGGFCRFRCNTVHHWMSELTLYQQWTHGDKILPNSRKLMLCLTFLPLAYYFAELSYLIFMCTSTQQWQLRFYLWPCLFLQFCFYFSSFWNFLNTFSTWNMNRGYNDEVRWRIKDAKSSKHGKHVFISFLHA